MLGLKRELELRPRVTAKPSVEESVLLKKLRAILTACGENVIDNDEALAKIAKVLS